MSTLDRHIALILWMSCLLVITVFVVMVRVGWIHDAAWGEACKTLRTGGSIPSSPLESGTTTNHCRSAL